MFFLTMFTLHRASFNFKTLKKLSFFTSPLKGVDLILRKACPICRPIIQTLIFRELVLETFSYLSSCVLVGRHIIA